MGEEETKKAESDAASVPAQAEEQIPAKEVKETAFNDVTKEKSIAPASEKIVADPVTEKSSIGSTERDAVLARVETEKRHALIKAWEESEKAKVDNKAHKRISAVGAWENTQKAYAEAKIKKFEEKTEKKKAEYAEKIKNKIAEIHKAAEQKKVTIEAKRSEDFVKVQETAEKFRATGYTPKAFFGCFSI